MDRVADDPCIGTEGNDAITGYPEQGVLLSLEGDAAAVEYTFCVPGFDTMNQSREYSTRRRSPYSVAPSPTHRRVLRVKAS